MFEPWQLAAIDAAGYNGIREEHIGAVAQEIEKLHLTEIDGETFRTVCYRAGVDPDNFTQNDLDALADRLNG